MARRIVSFCGFGDCQPASFLNLQDPDGICQCDKMIKDPKHSVKCKIGHHCEKCMMEVCNDIFVCNIGDRLVGKDLNHLETLHVSIPYLLRILRDFKEN
jgi:hypothetical protein